MNTDIQEKDGLYLPEMDLPGYDKKDIRAELKDGYLTISASKKEENETKYESGYVMRERYTGSCSRSFYVGDYVTENGYNMSQMFPASMLWTVVVSFSLISYKPSSRHIQSISSCIRVTCFI